MKRASRFQGQTLSKFLKDGGSKRSTDGGGGPTLGTPISGRPLPHDIIEFSPKSQVPVFAVCEPFLRRGFSLSEMVEATGISKWRIRKALAENGLAKLSGVKRKTPLKSPPRKRTSSIPPYGYAWLQGRLVEDPREYKVVLKICSLWRSGKSILDIAKWLTSQKVPTRHESRWHYKSINKIIQRQSNIGSIEKEI